MQNFCSNCGQKLTYDSTYCPHCGNLLKNQNDDSSDIKFFSKDVSAENHDNLNSFTNQNNGSNVSLEESRNQANESKVKTNTFAIAGFVLSLCSLATCGFTSILGLIFSIIGLIASKRYENDGKGFAIAGVVISVVFIIILVAFYLILTFSTNPSSLLNTNSYNGPMY